MGNCLHGIVTTLAAARDTQPPDRRGMGRILLHIVTHAEAHPVPPPTVTPDLAALPTAQRVYECLRLFLLDREFALSPGGQLRGVAKLICRIAVVLGVLLMAAAGVLALASLVLGIAVVVAGQLVAFLTLMVEAALLLLTLLAVGMALLLGVRVATRI